MPAERATMRQVREVLRLKFVGGVPTGEIARRVGVAASTVRATLKRFQAAGLSWPLRAGFSEQLFKERRLHPPLARSGCRPKGWPRSRPQTESLTTFGARKERDIFEANID